MQVTPLVRHLRERCPSFGGRVAGGIDWESIESSAKLESLRAHVVLTDEDADASFTENLVMQNVDEQFDVCVEFPQSAGDERGQAAGDQVDAIRRELCRALVGWRPGQEFDPIQYGGRELLVNNRAKAVYRFSFVTGYQLGRNRASDPAETWQELEQDGLPPLERLNIDVDFIDPLVDRNLSPTGPDGRIEIKTTEELQT
ncbi:hypothetical protein N7333_12860 [Pseudomonas sp. GD04158]|uniref:phage tail terminator protein n=1 Tax=Pseudomonas sp. GD04158 TaxID=2975439 RepID=UPI00244867B0|nr:hypothetical protein [Pseudomonas sp. GD04158]MDH0097464.1 hypothetical protein [Pseudomonas sp. GD04158]